MILDGELENVHLDRSAQIVIVGAGPAGMTLARELGGKADVLLIEGGGLESEGPLQDFLVGECAGIDYPLTETRIRQFGGSSALWAGYCAVFDRHDFAPKDWTSWSGWPFGIDEILPYYSDAARVLNLGKPHFNAEAIAEQYGSSSLLKSDLLAPTLWRFGSPTKRFGEEWRAEFESTAEFTTLLHAHVVDIGVDDTHTEVRSLTVRTLNGRVGRITSDIFVLACGGIETSRLLLGADSQVACGLGNLSGMVGRCFMEHPHRTITPLKISNTNSFENWTARGRDSEQNEFMFCIGLSAQVQEELRVLNARAHVFRTPQMRPEESPRVGLFMEQAPNPASRVLLSDKTDRLGMRRVCVDWRLTELDWRSFEITGNLMAREFERAGLGEMIAPIDGAPERREPVLHSNHHLGTTRMSTDKKEGVVDRNCRVHDLSNLYIAGGSVFPTVSWANPTFTVMALTFRLCAHLQSLVAVQFPDTNGEVCATASDAGALI